MFNSSLTHSVPRTIAIAGGGAAGLACAYALARRGARVCVFEAQDAGKGALWASGGMLAPGFETCFEAPETEAFSRFAGKAAALWDEWAPAIEQVSGRSLGYRRTGSITPAFSEAETDRLDRAQARARRFGVVCERLDGAQAAQAEPGLAPCFGALSFPGDGQLDNRALGPALVAAVRAEGGEVREHSPVLKVHPASEGVRVVTPNGEMETFDALILATGAAGELPGHLGEAAIAPVKGQMLAFAAPAGLDLDRVVRGLSIYLCAKPDGRILAGATSEPGRPDLATDASIDALAARARQAVPALKESPILEKWAGLRPASRDELPLLGPGRTPAIHLALGGYRNGVLFAPAMGEALAASLLDGTLPDYAWGLQATRFAPGG